jgi:predicted amidohydrolase
MPDFEDIYRREFEPIQTRKAFGQMNLYAGKERVREFDLAATVLMVKAGGTIHSLKRLVTADRTNIADLAGAMSIATFVSNRVLVNWEQATEPTEDAPFYLGARNGLPSSGLKVNSQAFVEHQYNQEAWIEKNQWAIDTALTEGSDVVCLGEFDFPPLDIDGEIRSQEESAELNRAHREWITSRLLQHGKPALIFAGSSHDWTEHGCVNVGEVFIADDDGRGLKVHPQRYLKRVAAGGLGETLTQVTSPLLPYFGTSLGMIAVLICVDAFDPGVIMSIVASSRGIDRVGMILVPSYNPSERLVRSCQQLSYLANCSVVYVNALETARHRKAQVFLSGISLQTWHEQLTNIEKMVRSGVKLDRRIADSIPGVRSLERLVHLTEIGRGMQIVPLEPGGQLMKWVIPHGFVNEATITLSDKYPFNRGRILATLASVED